MGAPLGIERAALEGKKVTQTLVFWPMRGHCELPHPLGHSGCLRAASLSPPRPLTPASAQPQAPLPAWVGKEVHSTTTHFPHRRTQAQRG